jgi:hypothetical protein
MAMSSGEYLRRIQEEQAKYIHRSKPRDASELTMINQAKASGHVFQREKGGSSAYSFGQSYGPTDHAIPANVYNPTPVETCCKTYVASGSQTNSGSTGVLQAAQKCAVCSDPDPLSNQGITIAAAYYDRSIPPFAQKLPGTAVSCEVCNTRYFPTPAQPNCACYSDSYHRTIIDKKFGDAGVPTTR